MAIAVLCSRALTGMNAPEVIVEAHLANGLPSFTIIEVLQFLLRDKKVHGYHMY